MNIRTITVALAAATMVLTAACGNDDAESSAPPSEPASAGAEAGQTIAARSGDSALGEILVGENGLTLYGFTQDTGGKSPCGGTCAEAWPPVLVTADWAVGPGLDSGIFSTIRRDDGSDEHEHEC